MTQYMLSVHDTGDGTAPEPEVMEQAYKQVDVLNAEMQSAGVWVFAGGLHPPSTATVVRVQDGEVLTTDGPFAETKEQLGGFWIIEAADLDVGVGVGGQGDGGLHGPGRGPSLPGGAGGLSEVAEGYDAEQLERIFREESGRVDRHPDPSLRRHRPRRRGGSGGVRGGDASAGRPTGLPPNPGAGSPPWPATAPSTGSDVRHPAMTAHAQAALLHERSRTAGAGGSRERRPPPAHLHLLPPGAGHERAGRPHPATARRARRRPRSPGRSSCPSRRWRKRLVRAKRKIRDGQDPVPRARATPSCPTGCRPCWPSSTWCSTRATRPPQATSWSAPTCAWKAIRLARLLAELMPDEPEVLGLLALLLLTESRRSARTGPTGPSSCFRTRTARSGTVRSSPKARRLVRRCLRRNQPGPYQIQAAINAVHSDAADRGRYRLASDPPAVRPAPQRRPDPGGGPEPCGRGG